MSRIDELIEIIKQSNNIVFFGGAGVSTESNIPDFRGATGLYTKKETTIPTEEILSSHFFFNDPQAFYDFYFAKMVYPTALPNACHLALAKLESMGKLQAIVTQNVDGLHQKAGSKNVLELHGSIQRNTCLKCGEHYDLNYMLTFKGKGVPKCTKCGGIVKPDVVLYEEALDDATVMAAIRVIAKADVLIVGGTSLVVYPAASFVEFFKGKHLILINEKPTPMDENFEFIIKEKLGVVFTRIMEEITN